MVVRKVREENGKAMLEMLEHLHRGALAVQDITVRILAAADHDGVCSAKMLAMALDHRNVKFLIWPVMENAHIVEHFERLKAESEVRSVVLLNCGASVDLQKLLEEAQDVTCFVIDAHRPVLRLASRPFEKGLLRLQNLSKHNQRVIVLDDDPIAEAQGVARQKGVTRRYWELKRLHKSS